MDEPGFPADAGAAAHVLVDALADEVTVEGADGHHLARARRLRAGEMVTAADGRGAWRPYAVAEVRRGAIVLGATGTVRREPELVPRLAVAFALTKGVKPETVVRQLTELGVDEVVPVVGERSVARARGGREPSVVERLQRVAREAAMQSRRARLPEIGFPVPLLDLAGRGGLVVAERGHPTGPPGPGEAGWTLLVGPEGGFSPSESDALRGAPRLAIGAHVLRAETAAVAGAAVLAAVRAPVVPPEGAETA
ncbi:MAG TPA: RsmE family RNA methyltransferase [Acidimicrobiia bacterium]|jgi:16S rRNA (uracil1498-N3)-methyltransferase